jgi:hypothetical protein
MKGFLYCFKVVGTKDSNDSTSFENIYKVDTTVHNITEFLKKCNNKRPSSKGVLELEFYIEIDNIYKLDIFENLYLYKYGKEANLYKIELSQIKIFIYKDLKTSELRKQKLIYIVKFVENVLDKKAWNRTFLNSFRSKKIIEDHLHNLKFIDLYEIYKKWIKNNKKSSINKAEMCEFLDLCETFTSLGKTNEYYEWEF